MQSRKWRSACRCNNADVDADDDDGDGDDDGALDGSLDDKCSNWSLFAPSGLVRPEGTGGATGCGARQNTVRGDRVHR